MLRWLQQWLPVSPNRRRSAEALCVDAEGQSVLTSNSEYYIEFHGIPVALLSEPERDEDSDWPSFLLTPLTDDSETLARLQDAAFWPECWSHGVVFRHRLTSAISPRTFPALRKPGRLTVRGLR